MKLLKQQHGGFSPWSREVLLTTQPPRSGLSVPDLPSLVTQLNELFAPGISSKAETLTEAAEAPNLPCFLCDHLSVAHYCF